jgi:hypothetical protein
MERGDFWLLIERNRRKLDRLVTELSGHGPEEIIAFEDHLTELLRTLDTPAHASAARARNDWFLAVRCAAVGAGRTTYGRVLADPKKLRKFARRELRDLLTVAPRAWELATGKEWDYASELSYESGMNFEAWGEPEDGLGTPHDTADPDPGHWGPTGDYGLDLFGYAHENDQAEEALARPGRTVSLDEALDDAVRLTAAPMPRRDKVRNRGPETRRSPNASRRGILRSFAFTAKTPNDR